MANTPTKPRWGRRILIVLALPVVLVAGLVALTPTLISAGLGKGSIVSAINANVNGTADYRSLSLSWFGEQSIEGLTITEPSGRKAVDVTVITPSSLLSFLSGGDKAITVHVSGAVEGDIRPDGSTSFADLVKPSAPGTPQPSSPVPPASQPGSSQMIPPNLAVNLNVKDFDVILHTPDGDTLQLDNVESHVVLDPGAPLTATLATVTQYKGKAGRITLDAKAGSLLDGAGALNFASGLDAKLTVVNVLIPAGDKVVDLSTLTTTVKSADLTGRVDLAVEGKGMIDGTTASTVNATIAAEDIIDAAGTPSFGIEKLTGTVQAQQLPTVLAQPFLAGTEVDLARDLGPLLDVNADFGGGESRRVSATIAARQLSIELSALVNGVTRAIEGDKFNLEAQIAPETVKALAAQDVDKPIALVAKFTRFTVPAARPDGTLPLDGIGFSGRIDSPGLVTLRNQSGAAIATAGDLVVVLESPTLGEGVTVKADATVENGTLAVNQKLSNLFAADGSLDPVGVVADGTVALTNVPADRLVQLMPEQQALLAQILTAPLNLNATTGRSADGAITAVASLDAGNLTASIDTSRADEVITVKQAQVALRATPGLVAAAQASETPIVLDQPATIRVTLAATSVREQDLREKGLAAVPLNAVVQSDALVVSQVPGVATRLTVADLRSDVSLLLGDVIQAALKGSASVAGQAPLALVAFDLKSSMPAEQPIVVDGSLRAESVAVAAVEGAMGRPSGQLSDVFGSTGQVVVNIDTTGPGAYTVVVTPEFHQLKGVLDVGIDPTQIVASMKGFDITLPEAAAKRLLAPADGTAGWTTQGDLGLHPTVTSIRLPRALASGESFDPRSVKADVALSLDPATLVSPAGVVVGVQSFNATLNCDDLSRGVNVAVRSELSSADLEARGLDLSGSATNLVAPDSSISLQNAVVQLSGGGALTIKSPALEKMLNTAPVDAPADPAMRVKVASDLTLTPQIRSLRVPLSMASDGPIDPSLVKIDIGFTGSPLVMTYPDGRRLGLEGLNAAVLCPDLRQGATFTLVANATANDAAAGELDVKGAIRELLDSQSRLNDAPVLDLTAKAQNVPTALADQLQNMNGMLVAALGPSMNARVQATALSANGGTLAMDFKSENGFIQAPLITSADKLLVVDPGQPIKAELAITKELRDRLLYRLHPIFADIRQTEQPLRLTVNSATVPVDGNAGRLNGDIRLDFGAVQFDTSSSILKLLEFVKQTEKKTIDGLIDPLAVKISSGRVTYQDFAVHIHKKSETTWLADLPFSGDIDLAAKPPRVNLIRTSIPFDIFTKSIEEVPSAVGLARIDVDLTGELYDAQGNRKELKQEYKLGFKALDDIKKDPGKILEDPKIKDAIGDIFKKIQEKND